MPASRIYNPFVGAGGGGTPNPNAEEVQTQGFTFSDSTVFIFAIPNNAKVISASVAVETAFNDPSATLMIGDASLNNRLLQASQNDLTEVGSYQGYNEFEYVSSTNINIYLNAGTSTQGKGFITIFYNLNN